jgi:hypothetical protein
MRQKTRDYADLLQYDSVVIIKLILILICIFLFFLSFFTYQKIIGELASQQPLEHKYVRT